MIQNPLQGKIGVMQKRTITNPVYWYVFCTETLYVIITMPRCVGVG